MRLNQFPHRGMWWMYPSLLESCEGPWDGERPASTDPVIEWKRILDFLAERRMNTLFAHLAPMRIDWRWGLHWVLEFPEFPAARMCDGAAIARRQDAIREILSHAASRGIEVFAHHYNFEATYGFVRSENRIHEKWMETHRTGAGSSFVDSLRWVCGDICFNEAAYQRFLQSCWREAFQAFPMLKGFLISMGEDALCSCPECAGTANRATSMIGLARLFVESMRGHGKTPLIRTWFYARNLFADMPTGVVYVMKHSLFDCVTSEPDPLIDTWLRHGHEVWVTKELYGENAGPMVWADPGFFKDVVAQTARPGINGLVGFHNAMHSHLGYRYAMQRVNLESFLGSLGDAGFDGARHYARVLTALFPRALVEEVARTISLYREMIFGISKVIGASFEGYTFAFQLLSPLKGPTQWPGTLATEGDDETVNLTPPAHWRKGIATVKELVDHAQREAWSEDLFAGSCSPNRSPLGFLEELSSKCEQAEIALESLHLRVPPESRQELSLLRASARTARQMGAYWVDEIRARLFYEGALNSLNELAVRTHLARRCLESYRQTMRCNDELLQCILDFPEGYYDVQGYLGFYGQTVERKRQELAELERELAHLADVATGE